MVNNRIVITGIGLVTPLGVGREITWSRVKNGESAISWDPEFQRLMARVPLATEGQRVQKLAELAAREALEDAGIPNHESRITNPEFHIGCCVSSSKQNLFALSDVWGDYLPDQVPWSVARALGCQGPVRNVVAACATGVHSLVQGIAWLLDQECDIVLAGSAESSLHPLVVAGFGQMGVLAPGAIQDFAGPFDKNRRGFVMGEGAGVFVLETLEQAQSRHAKIYAELKGWAMGADASHITRFNSNGHWIAHVLKRAMDRAQFVPEDIGYLNVHGTGTTANDSLETRAIQEAFGSHSKRLSLSSTKAATGHLLGAAGSVEFGLSLLALRDHFVPPTLFLHDPDPLCALDYTPQEGRSRPMKTVMNLSFGFGGPLGALLATSVE